MDITLTPNQVDKVKHGDHHLYLTGEQVGQVVRPHAGPIQPVAHTATHSGYSPAPAHHADPHGGLGSEVTWEQFFGQPLSFARSHNYMTPAYTKGRIIPVEGIAIAFDIPAHEMGTMAIQSIETNVVGGSRFGTISQRPLDWHGLAHQSWGTGNVLAASVNYADPRAHLVLHPGRYYLNFKNNHPRADQNWFIARCYVAVHK